MEDINVKFILDCMFGTSVMLVDCLAFLPTCFLDYANALLFRQSMLMEAFAMINLMALCGRLVGCISAD